MFLVDIILSFYTSIPECEKHNEITDKRKIATNYLKTWFGIDLLSIMPFHMIFDSYETYNVFQFCSCAAIEQRARVPLQGEEID